MGTMASGYQLNPQNPTFLIDHLKLSLSTTDKDIGFNRPNFSNVGKAVWRIKKLTGTKGFASSTSDPAVESFHKAIAEVTKNPIREVIAVGASDARYFADDGIVLLTFGPGNAKDGHKANEFVPVDELELAAMIQLEVVSDLLGLGI